MVTEKTARSVLVVLIGVAAFLVGLVFWPFATSLFLAAVLASTFGPWMDRLSRLLRSRAAASAVLTLGLVVVVVLPVSLLATGVVHEAAGAAAWLRTGLGSEGVLGLVEHLPASLRKLGEHAYESIPKDTAAVEEFLASYSGRAAAALGGVLSKTGAALLQTLVMLVALFFFLVDGPRLVAWLNEVFPLRPGQFPELLAEFRRVTVAVLWSTLATAAVQTVVAFVGYLIAGIPNAPFFALLTFAVGLVPVAGATSVVVVLALVKLANGQTGAAIFLAFWAVGVSLTDNFVKPLFIRGGFRVHGAIIFFALLGGLAALGPIGILIGPLVVAFLIAVVRMYRRDFES